jgi:hypothetical protein
MEHVQESFGPRPRSGGVASLCAGGGPRRRVRPSHGLILQHNGIVWADLVAAHALFSRYVEASTHGRVGTWHPNGVERQALGAYGRVRGWIEWRGWP